MLWVCLGARRGAGRGGQLFQVRGWLVPWIPVSPCGRMRPLWDPLGSPLVARSLPPRVKQIRFMLAHFMCFFCPVGVEVEFVLEAAVPDGECVVYL